MIQPCLLGTTILRTQRASFPHTFRRYKSITAAIERGRRNTSRDQTFGDTRRTNDISEIIHTPSRGGFQRSRSSKGDEISRNRDKRDVRERRFQKDNEFAEWRSKPRQTEGRQGERSSRKQSDPKPHMRSHRTEGFDGFAERTSGSFRSGQMESRSRDTESEKAPESLPYATAASEFLYGYSSVLAAIKANRRKLYKLYIHNRGINHEGKDAIVQRARALRLSIQEVGDEYLRAFDKSSNGRPHNGFILESSPLPVPPITELGSSSITAGTFELTLDKQSKEDALVNGTKNQYMYKSSGWRHPLVLYVDGVLDEGNLGAIARSAYFLGVDALVTPSRQSAPWSHIALKASAGAAEAIPVFQVSAAADFLGRSAREGWRIYASDSLPPGEQQPHSVSTTSASSLADFASSVIYTYARSSKRLPAEHCPVESHPTILMMGAESTGLRTSLLNLAHYKVGIKHGRDVDEVGVDSLNVSVAASLLCYQVLQKPKPRRKAGELMF